MGPTPRRFVDARFARLALVIAALAAAVCAALASPWVRLRDPVLARAVDAEADGWRVRLATVACATEEEQCDPEQVGTVRVIHAVQLAAIALIAVLGVAARRRQPGLVRTIGDAVLVPGTIAGMFVAIRWAFAELPEDDALLATGAVAAAGMLVFWLRFHRRSPGPVGIVTFIVVKAFAVVGSPLAVAVIGLKRSLPPAWAAAPVAGAAITAVGGASLAIPIAMALLAFHPFDPGERGWAHLAPRRGFSPAADRP